MAVLIASDVLRRIVAHAKANVSVEVCGLLFGTGAAIDACEPCPNVANDPVRRFEIDPARLLSAHRHARGGGPRIVGHYHSHPGGDPTPSRQDAADATPDDALWLIVGAAEARLWRAVTGGAIHGRFDPLPLRVRD